MKKNFCRACHNLQFGVKTRIAVPHTCGLADITAYAFYGKNHSTPIGYTEVETPAENNRKKLTVDDLKRAKEIFDNQSLKELRIKEQELIDKWIKEMHKAGFTSEQMQEVFRVAAEMHVLQLNQSMPLPGPVSFTHCESCQSFYDTLTNICCPQCGN